MILPDLLEKGLKLVICGTAPGNISAAAGAYYAAKGNLFYPTLAQCGFTPVELEPGQYPELLKYGIGLTDLVKYTFGLDSSLKADDYDIEGFERKIFKYNPKVVCFNSKTAAKAYLKCKSTGDVKLGLQKSTIGKSKIYVAPSTSPQAKVYWDLSYWQMLKRIVEKG